jgi:hypothetical protein
VEERLSTKGIEAKQGCPFFGAAPRFLTQFLSPTNLSHPITILASNFGISNLFPNRFFFKISFTNKRKYFLPPSQTLLTQNTVHRKAKILDLHPTVWWGHVVCAKEN